MKRAATILAAAAAVTLCATLAAGTASAQPPSAQPPSDPVTSPEEPSRDWHRYRDFPNFFVCEGVGAAGVVLGRWNDWWCDDDGVLWVER